MTKGNVSDPLISRWDRGDCFEVRRDEEADGDFKFIGFFNAERSVEATDPNVCFRGLWRKHRVGLAEPGTIDLRLKRQKRRR